MGTNCKTISIPAEFTLQMPTADKTAHQAEIQEHTSQMTVSVFVQPPHCWTKGPLSRMGRVVWKEAIHVLSNMDVPLAGVTLATPLPSA